MKEKQSKPKARSRKEIVRIRAEMNDIKSRKTTERMKKTKDGFFESIYLE